MDDLVLIYLRGDEDLREVVWDLLERNLIVTADSVVRHEVYLKGGTKRKVGSNQPCMLLVARRATLDDTVARLREAAGRVDLSAYTVPVLAAV